MNEMSKGSFDKSQCKPRGLEHYAYVQKSGEEPNLTPWAGISTSHKQEVKAETHLEAVCAALKSCPTFTQTPWATAERTYSFKAFKKSLGRPDGSGG